MPLIGRKQEITQLSRLLSSDRAEFLAVYGRRRIGKTYLIREYFGTQSVYFEVTGVKNATPRDQLKRFAHVFAEIFCLGRPIEMPSSWMDAFELLAKTLKKLKINDRIILFFDELPWLASKRSKFLEALEYLWNHYLSKDKRIVLIVCGSAAAWMIKKIINNRAGLHGRLTQEIRLIPFTLSETKAFFEAKNINMDSHQLIELYMSLGGVPKYLDFIHQLDSSAQLINQLFFEKNSPLEHEFYKLYGSLFDNYEHHLSVVKALASNHYGLSKEKLLQLSNLRSGGSSTNILRELEESGFIIYLPAFGKRKTGGYYKLVDEFSLFYLKWVDKYATSRLVGRNYWTTQRNSSAWYTWAGYAFENLCWRHLDQIVAALGLGAVNITMSHWQNQDAQIDLLIDRADRCINLCEIKYSEAEFQMNQTVEKAMQKKRQIFREVSKTKKTLINTLITAQSVNKNAHFFNAVDQHITADVLFAE